LGLELRLNPVVTVLETLPEFLFLLIELEVAVLKGLVLMFASLAQELVELVFAAFEVLVLALVCYLTVPLSLEELVYLHNLLSVPLVFPERLFSLQLKGQSSLVFFFQVLELGAEMPAFHVALAFL
jgi:hypothetical protein